MTTADPPTDCLFCRIAAGVIPSRQVFADEHAVAFLDLSPLHRGHTLVIPRRHIVDVLDGPGALTEIAPAIEQVAALLRDRLDADGVNVFSSAGEVAGQVVFHLHVHVVPRYAEVQGSARLFDRTASAEAADLDAVLAAITA